MYRKPTLSKLTHVLAVGRRFSSDPASRIAKLGTSSLNPLHKRQVHVSILRRRAMRDKGDAQQWRSAAARGEAEQLPALLLVE